MWPGPRPSYLRTKWNLDPFSRLTTTDMTENLGGEAVPHWREVLGRHLAQFGEG